MQSDVSEVCDDRNGTQQLMESKEESSSPNQIDPNDNS